MKNIATLIILITTNSLLRTAALEISAPAQSIVNINIKQKKDKTIIKYQLNDHTFSFDAKILTASNTIKNIQEDCTDPLDQQLPFLTKQLFDGLNHKQVALIIKSLQRNTADINDASKPSAQATRFVQKRNTKNLCWLADQTNRWNIRYIYHAAVSRLAQVIGLESTPTLSRLNEDVSHDIAQKIDYSNLKLVIGTILQQTINPYEQKLIWPATAFNPDGSQILLAETSVNTKTVPVCVYDIKAKQIIREINPLTHGNVSQIQYACNGSRIIIKIKKDPLGTLCIYNNDGILIQAIPLPDVYGDYDIYEDRILVNNTDHVTEHSDNETSHICPPAKHNILHGQYSPNGLHIYITEATWPETRLFIYNAHSKTLLKTIECSTCIGPQYSKNGSALAIATLANGILLYDTQALENPPQKIIHLNSANIKAILFSPDSNQLFILTKNLVSYLYDRLNGALKQITLPHPVFHYNNYFAQYSSDSSQLLFGTTDHWMLEFRQDDGIFTCNAKENPPQLKHLLHPKSIRSFEYYDPDCSRMLCRTTETEDLYVHDAKTGGKSLSAPLAKACIRISYSPDKAHIAICAEKYFVIQPTLSNVKFTDIRHLQLMFKAWDDWQHRQQPYAITTKKEKMVYDSLDQLLQDERLFTVNI